MNTTGLLITITNERLTGHSNIWLGNREQEKEWVTSLVIINTKTLQNKTMQYQFFISHTKTHSNEREHSMSA